MSKKVLTSKSLVRKLQKSVQKHLMTSIFSIHNHQTKVKQHPIRRASYLALLVLAVAVPVGSRKVFASGFDTTAQLYVDGQTLNIASSATTVKEVIDAAGITLSDKDIVEPGLETEITDGYKINVYRSVPVIIQDKGANVEIETAQKTAEGITKEAGITLNAEDGHEIVASDISAGDLKPGITLKVDRADTIKLNLYGAITDQRTQAGTVQEFLDEKSIKLQEGDTLAQSPSQAITDGMAVEVRNDSREVQVADEEIAMPEEIIKDVNKDTSFRQVQSPGYSGQKKVTYEIKKVNGKEVSRTVVSEEIIKPALKQTTIVGAKKVTKGANVSAQAKELMAAAGIAQSDWDAAYSLIQKESGWNSGALNRSSGACGLVQALPCSKLGPNWSDPVVSLRWGNTYVKRWGGWNGAWQHSQQKGWY